MLLKLGDHDLRVRITPQGVLGVEILAPTLLRCRPQQFADMAVDAKIRLNGHRQPSLKQLLHLWNRRAISRVVDFQPLRHPSSVLFRDQYAKVVASDNMATV